MITPSQIVTHLQKYLPRVTDLFTDNLGITQVISSGGNTLTIDTAAAHGLAENSQIVIKSGKTPNTISSVTTVNDNFLNIEFQDEHDFTTPNVITVSEPLPCVGFNEDEWNTTLSIINVPDKNSVVVEYPTGASGTPTFSPGAAIGYEERPLSIFGIQTVSAVNSPTQFEVELQNVPEIPDGTLIDLTATTGVRVVAVDNIDRADQIYAEQPENDDLWAFVIMMDVDVSKDRHTLNDSVGSFTFQNEMRLKILNNFSIVVFFRSAESISSATAQELAYGDIYISLLKVMYGFAGFNSDESQSNYVTITNGHGVGTSNVAYYSHVYDWQLPVDINFNNGFDFYEDSAFRSFNGTFGMFEKDNEEKLTFESDIDP